MTAIPPVARSPSRAGPKNTCGRPRRLTPRLPVSPPRALAIAAELMKTAEAVATARQQSLGDDDAQGREHTPYPAHEDLPGEHSGGVAGQSEAEIRADAERRAEDHQVHNADMAGNNHGHRHQDQLYQRLDADDSAADRRRQMHVVAHVYRQVAVLDRLTRVDEHVQPGERDQRQHLPELRALREALGLHFGRGRGVRAGPSPERNSATVAPR